MPTPAPPDNSEIIFNLMVKVVTPLIGAVVALVVWAWKRMEKNQDRIETALTAHVQENDAVHDKLFNEQRDSDAKLNRLIGEHKATHAIKDKS